MLKLELFNFGKHRSRTVEIPTNKLVKISGLNSIGKSTILNAILFAFYGIGEDVCTHGEKKCMVILTIDTESNNKLVIKRSAKPSCRLIVDVHLSSKKGIEYEDDAAQSFLNNEFLGMDDEEFILSSYVVQREFASIIALSPANQLDFVKKLTKIDNSDDIKEAKKIIKQVYESKIRLDKQIEFLDEQLEKKFCEIEKYISDRSRKINEIEKEIDSYRDDFSVLEKRLQQLKTFKTDKCQVEEHDRQHLQTLKHKFDLQQNKNNSIRKIRELEQSKQKIMEELKVSNSSNTTDGSCVQNEIETRINQVKSKCVKNKEDFNKFKSFVIDFEKEISFRKELAKMDEKIKTLQNQQWQDEEYQSKEKELETIKNFFVTCQQTSAIQSKKKEIVDKISDIKLIFKEFDLFSGLLVQNESDIFFLKSSLEFLKNEIEQVNPQYSNLTCPQCEVMLVLIKKERRLVIQNLNKSHDQIVTDTSHDQIVYDNMQNILTHLMERITNLIQEYNYYESVTCETNEMMSESDNVNYEKQYHLLLHSFEEQKNIKRKIEDLFFRRNILIENNTTLNSSSLKKMLTDCKKEKKTSAIQKFFQQEIENLNTSQTNYNFDTFIEKKKQIEHSFEKKIDKDNEEYTIQNSKFSELCNVLKELESLDPCLISTDMVNIKESEIRDMEKKLEQLFQEIKQVNNEIEIVQQLLNKHKNINLVEKIFTDIKNDLDKLESSAKELEKETNKLDGFYGLIDTYRKAELTSIQKVINTINVIAADHINKLFGLVVDPVTKLSVTPPSIRLCISSEKNKKIKLKTIVEKGDNKTRFKSLSGGDQQMCELAFILAINEMKKSKFLFLDECLNNLHPALNFNVVNYIKGNVFDKTIIVIAHESICGIFGHEINL